MRKLIMVALLVFPPAVLADQKVYISCKGDRRVVVCAVDSATGKLRLTRQVDLQGRPGAMTLSPDGTRLYVMAVRRIRRGRRADVVTIHRKTLKVVGSAEISNRAAYLRVSPSGSHLLTAHYGSGEVNVYRIQGKACTSDRADHRKTERTAHAVEFDPSGAFVFVPHTASNKVVQFTWKNGKLLPNGFAAGPDEGRRYHQPRHIRFHPRIPTLAYTSNERGGGISLWQLDRTTGKLKRLQTLNALPPGFTGDSAAAEVRITPNGRFAYVSNRDRAKTPKGADTIAAFALDAQGRMTAIGHVPTVRFPRSFTIDATGRYLYAAGQRDHQVAAYRIDPKTGRLTEIERITVPKVPSWVLCE